MPPLTNRPLAAAQPPSRQRRSRSYPSPLQGRPPGPPHRETGARASLRPAPASTSALPPRGLQPLPDPAHRAPESAASPALERPQSAQQSGRSDTRAAGPLHRRHPRWLCRCPRTPTLPWPAAGVRHGPEARVQPAPAREGRPAPAWQWRPQRQDSTRRASRRCALESMVPEHCPCPHSKKRGQPEYRHRPARHWLGHCPASPAGRLGAPAGAERRQCPRSRPRERRPPTRRQEQRPQASVHPRRPE